MQEQKPAAQLAGGGPEVPSAGFEDHPAGSDRLWKFSTLLDFSGAFQEGGSDWF
jgi:hypothetical protein